MFTKKLDEKSATTGYKIMEKQLILCLVIHILSPKKLEKIANFNEVLQAENISQ